MIPDQILTIPEVAGLLRVAEKTVYTLVQKGELPAFKVGGQWRFSRGAIQAWIEERTRPSPRAARPAAAELHGESYAPARADPALTEVVRRLVEAYAPERIYLFGSQARGEAGSDSDYDLLVIVPDDASPERRRSRLAYQALRGTGTAADVVVCTRSYFEARLHLSASLPATVVREGILVHAA